MELQKELLSVNRVTVTENTISVDGGTGVNYLVARRTEDGPWLTLDNHDLADITTPIIDDYLAGKTASMQEARELVEKPLMNEILKRAQPLLTQKIKEFKDQILNFENKSVVRLYNEEKNKINEVSSEIFIWQTYPILERLPDEAKILTNYGKILNNYPECFEKAKKYARAAVDIFNAHAHDSDLSSDSKLIVENVRANCELFQEVLTKQMRALPLNQNVELMKKVFSQHEASSVEELVEKLTG